MPSQIEPTKAVPVEKLPEGDWLYEIKFDRYRALAFKDGKGVRLVSRNKKGVPLSSINRCPEVVAGLNEFPSMAKLLRSMRKVALRSSCFKYSKALVTSRWSILPLICCFWMRKICAHSRLVSARRKLLAKLLEKAPENIRLSGELHGSKDELLPVAQEFGL